MDFIWKISHLIRYRDLLRMTRADCRNRHPLDYRTARGYPSRFRGRDESKVDRMGVDFPERSVRYRRTGACNRPQDFQRVFR
jgi:hypothetical protein